MFSFHKKGMSVFTQYLKSPIGILRICSDGNAITQISLCEQVKENTPDLLTAQAAKELSEYFLGKRKAFTLPLSPSGTAFQTAVWTALQTLPYGSTVTYGELARLVGKPKSCRAVGSAVGKNPILILIPCHRVLAANGIGGFAVGLPVKRQLLSIEEIDYSAKKGKS